MITITHINICDDDIGEADAFFDANGKLLAAWSNNDAHWRGGYMNTLLNALDIEVLSTRPTKKQLKQVKEHFGL